MEKSAGVDFSAIRPQPFRKLPHRFPRNISTAPGRPPAAGGMKFAAFTPWCSPPKHGKVSGPVAIQATLPDVMTQNLFPGVIDQFDFARVVDFPQPAEILRNSCGDFFQ